MAAAVAVKREATIDDLYKVVGKAEIVDGEIVHMSPTGYVHGKIVSFINASLVGHERKTKSGSAFGDNVGFIVNLPNRRSFSPDVAWYTGPIPEPRRGFLPVAPDFAVELRSPDDYGPRSERRLEKKRYDYFAAGTRVVWDVDADADNVVKKYVFDQPNLAVPFRRGETADAEPAVPGWSLAVNELLP